jgi:hypothetical protein
MLQAHLAHEHRDQLRGLDELRRFTTCQRSEWCEHADEIGIGVLARLVVEERIIAPVHAGLLWSEEMRRTHRLHLTSIFEALVRAVQAGSAEQRQDAIDVAHERLAVHADRTQVSVLPALYRVYAARDQRRIVSVYGRAVEELSRRFRGELVACDEGDALGLDPQLLRTLEAAARAEVDGQLPAADGGVRSGSVGPSSARRPRSG